MLIDLNWKEYLGFYLEAEDANQVKKSQGNPRSHLAWAVAFQQEVG